jgi:hypothetical protein
VAPIKDVKISVPKGLGTSIHFDEKNLLADMGLQPYGGQFAADERKAAG